MGTPELAGASLRALLNSPNLEMISVVTQPDRPKGRDLKLQPSPVKQIALQSGVQVLQPERARDEQFIRQMQDLRPELICVAAFGQILPRSLLDIPNFGCVNVHTSLLPKYRGAAPIQRAILDDEPETGVTIMKMDEGLDTGPILSQESTPISAEDNAGSLHDRLAVLGADLLLKTIPLYIRGELQPHAQPDGATYAPKIRKQDGHIDWSRPARTLWNQVRGLTPWPGTFTFFGAGSQRRLLKIHHASICEQSGEPGVVINASGNGIVVACGSSALRIDLLQLEGGKRLTAEQFLAGHPLLPGQRLG